MTFDDVDATFTATDFAEISRTVADIAGIQLREGKEGLVRGRLGRRVRQVGAPSYRAYLEHLRADPTGRELAHMVDLLTTNKTNFFREAAHFDLFRAAVLPAFGDAPDGLRVWSAGCSTGEEPYTLAMILRDTLAESARNRARVLGTDISARVLAQARAGVYADAQAADVPPELLRRHFVRVTGPDEKPAWSAGPGLREAVRFAPLNLLDAWPMRGPFHAIFCRNVMIYFDKPTQAELVRRFHTLLAPGGYLFVGHSESLNGFDHAFGYVQPAVYCK